MAKIELDISEYDLLRDKGKLLEEALSREKQWSEQVDKLNQEKIEAYQKAEKQIVIRTVTEKREFLIPSQASMDNVYHIFRKLQSSTLHTADRNQYLLSIINDVLVNKAQAVSKISEEQSFQGLDEFIKQAKAEAYTQLTVQSKKALEKEPIYDESIKNSKKLEKINLELFEQNQKLISELVTSKELAETRLTLIETLNSYFYHIRVHIEGTNIFNYKDKIKKLLTYLEKIKI